MLRHGPEFKMESCKFQMTLIHYSTQIAACNLSLWRLSRSRLNYRIIKDSGESNPFYASVNNWCVATRIFESLNLRCEIKETWYIRICIKIRRRQVQMKFLRHILLVLSLVNAILWIFNLKSLFHVNLTHLIYMLLNNQLQINFTHISIHTSIHLYRGTSKKLRMWAQCYMLLLIQIFL